MKKCKSIRLMARRAVVGLGLLPMLAIVGCEPVNADTLQEFVVDFARSAVAAWLL